MISKVKYTFFSVALMSLGGCVVVPAAHVGPNDTIVTELETGRTYVRPKSGTSSCLTFGAQPVNSNGFLVIDGFEIPLGYYDPQGACY